METIEEQKQVEAAIRAAFNGAMEAWAKASAEAFKAHEAGFGEAETEAALAEARATAFKLAMVIK